LGQLESRFVVEQGSVMSNSSPPGQRPPHLRDDEPIALLIAALSFGAIFFWIFNQSQERFSLGNFLNKANETKAPQVITTSPLFQSPEVETNSIQKGARAAEPPSTTGVITTPGTPTAAIPTPTPSIATPTTQPTAVPVPIPPTSSGITPTTPKAAIAFVDVPKTYWAYSFITALSAQGIVSGFPDGTFKPDQPVTRAEFATQVEKAFTKPNKQPAIAFTDVPQGDPRSTAIDQAVKANFMSGYPDKTFRPTQKVSRTEATISMARGLALPIPSDPNAILQNYPDQNQVPDWARSLMAASIQAGLFSGDPDTKQLNPNQSASRADIAAFVYKGQNLGAK